MKTLCLILLSILCAVHTTAQSKVDSLVQQVFDLFEQIKNNPAIAYGDFNPREVPKSKIRYYENDSNLTANIPTERVFKNTAHWGGEIILNTATWELKIPDLWGSWAMISTERIIFF